MAPAARGNRTIDELRRERRLELVDPGALDGVYEDALPDDATIDAVRRLGPERRAVVVLRFWLDWSLEQIADALDLPLGTVSSRLTRALAYDVVRVRKTRGIETAVPGRDPGGFPLGLDFQPFILRDQAGRVLAPRPLGNSKVSLCRRAPALG